MTGFVYFISYPDSQWIKVGYARNVQKRLNQLRVSSPESLFVVAAVPGTREDEKAMQAVFGCTLRVREWFKADIINYEILERAKTGATISQLIEMGKRLRAERDENRRAFATKIAAKYEEQLA